MKNKYFKKINLFKDLKVERTLDYTAPLSNPFPKHTISLYMHSEQNNNCHSLFSLPMNCNI